MFLVILLVVWLGMVALWFIFSRAFRSADMDRVKARLTGIGRPKKTKNSADAPALINEDKPIPKILGKIMDRFKLETRLQELLEQAGTKWTPARFTYMCLACFVAGFVLAWTFMPAAWRQFASLPALLLAFAPLVMVLRRRTARMRRFEEIFPDSLEFVSRSMRAGHAFSVSMEMIHREFQEPLASEFRRTFEESNLGLPLEVALQKLAKRVPSLDVQFFVSAVLLQKRTGGNLAEILDKLAYVIRERFKLRGKIRAISAHGRMTGLALSCIPIAVAILMFYTNPDYVRFFFEDDTGNIMAGSAIALQIIGYLIIRKIVTIEV